MSPILAGPVVGIVVLAKIGELGNNSDPWLGASFSQGPLRFLFWYSPFIAIALAVCVNVVVTAAIVTHIIRSKRNIAKLVGQPHAGSMYSGVVATLVESAFPAAFFGVTASLIPVVGHASEKRVLDVMYFTPKILWIAFAVRVASDFVPKVSTADSLSCAQALAPQLIIIRVMARSSHSVQERRGPLTSAEVPLMFEPYVTATGTIQSTRATTESAEESITKPVQARSTHMLQRASGSLYSQC
jgi:hypothetical protein